MCYNLNVIELLSTIVFKININVYATSNMNCRRQKGKYFPVNSSFINWHWDFLLHGEMSLKKLSVIIVEKRIKLFTH